MTAADEAHRRTEGEELDLDEAEMALAGAGLTWRDAGRTE
jgi:hypothetical protein